VNADAEAAGLKKASENASSISVVAASSRLNASTSATGKARGPAISNFKGKSVPLKIFVEKSIEVVIVA